MTVDAVDIARIAIRERTDNASAVEAIRQAALALSEQRHPLSGLSEGAEPAMRTFMAFPRTDRAVARVRTLDGGRASRWTPGGRQVPGDSALAALLVAAYRAVAVESVRRRLAGGDLADIATTREQRLNAAFDAVAHCISASHLAAPTP